MSRQSTQKHLGVQKVLAKVLCVLLLCACVCVCVCVGPAAVGVAAEKNFSTSTANGAVGLVTIVVVHVGHLQVHVLNTQKRNHRNTSGFSDY